MTGDPRLWQWDPSGLLCPFFRGINRDLILSLRSPDVYHFVYSINYKRLACVQPGPCPQGTHSLIGEVNR